MKFPAINSIDLKTLARAPAPIKAGTIAVLCAALAGNGYYFDTQKQLQLMKQTETAELELRQTFEVKQRMAANLELYKGQLEDMRRSFGAMLRQLPSKTEVPSLIVDISQTGLASGLEIDLFKPGSELRKDFYAENPFSYAYVGITTNSASLRVASRPCRAS